MHQSWSAGQTRDGFQPSLQDWWNLTMPFPALKLLG
jgi:hypothetical protein